MRKLLALFFLIAIISLNICASAASDIRTNVTKEDFYGKWYMASVGLGTQTYPASKISTNFSFNIFDNKAIVKVIENGMVTKTVEAKCFLAGNKYTIDTQGVNFIMSLHEDGKMSCVVDSVKMYFRIERPEPAIGMTADEIRESTWGAPNEINKTTYAWGTTEQWCYSGYKYIYFTNGIVDAIQE